MNVSKNVPLNPKPYVSGGGSGTKAKKEDQIRDEDLNPHIQNSPTAFYFNTDDEVGGHINLKS